MKTIYAVVVSDEDVEREWESIYAYYETRSKAQSVARSLVRNDSYVSAGVLSVKCEEDYNINDILFAVVGFKEIDSDGFSKILYIGNDLNDVRNKLKEYNVLSNSSFVHFKIE
jgi:hypothetical protein